MARRKRRVNYSDFPHHRTICKLRKIVEAYGMRLRTRRFITFSGEYCHKSKTAWVNLDNPANVVISTVFHELGHHLDLEAGLFRKYYDGRSSNRTMRRLALRAERHADLVGRRLCKKYFPKVKFHEAYVDQEDIDWLLNEFFR